MKTLRELGQINMSLQLQKDADEFVRLCHFLLRHDGKFSQALRLVDESKLENVRGLTPRIVEILRRTPGAEISRVALRKAAVPAMGIASSALQDFTAISSGFVNSLYSAGIFDRMLADGAMAEIPLQGGSVGAVMISAAGYSVQEGQMKPVSKLSISGAQASPMKAHCAVIISKELSRMPIPNPLIARELRSTIILESDAKFLDAITAGVTPATSFGTTASNARADIEYLLRAVGVRQNSKVYLISTPQIVTTLSQKENGGQPAFPMLGPNGGEVSPGLLLLPSDGCPAGFLICVDATRIAAASSELIPSEIEEAILQMESAPDSPPTAATNMTSLWQNNLVGIRIERYILAQKLSTDAVKIINNANGYVAGAGSP